MSLFAWLALVAFGLIVAVTTVRGARRRRMEQLQATWGIQSPRAHRFEELATSHRSRVEALGEPLALDDRTWNLLDASITRRARSDSMPCITVSAWRIRRNHCAPSKHWCLA